MDFTNFVTNYCASAKELGFNLKAGRTILRERSNENRRVSRLFEAAHYISSGPNLVCEFQNRESRHLAAREELRSAGGMLH